MEPTEEDAKDTKQATNLISTIPPNETDPTTEDVESRRQRAREWNTRLQEHLIAENPPTTEQTEAPTRSINDDELFVAQEPAKKRTRRTPYLTNAEIRESVKVGLDVTNTGKLPKAGLIRSSLKAIKNSKGKGKNGHKAAEIDITTLGGTDIIADAHASSLLPEMPVSTHGNKENALKELIASVPAEAKKDANSDKKVVIDATKMFNTRPKLDKKGGWKHRLLETSLFHHQILGAAFMREREASERKPKGGMLCDVMGLGKTIQTLANIVDGESETLEDNANTTLIVAPRGVIDHWKSQINKHVIKSFLGPVLSHYAGSRVESTNAPETMLLHKIIVTSYEEVRISYPKLEKPEDMAPEEVMPWAIKKYKESVGPLHQIRFRRIILDEGQQICNPNSQTSVAIRALHAHYKWILSGTPLLNHTAEFWPYFNFLGVPDIGSFYNFIRNFCDGSDLADQRLVNIVRTVVFRRTHRSRLFACPLITLPKLGEQVVAVQPLAIEKAIYKMVTSLFIDGMNCMASSDSPEAQNRCFLTMLLKLRMLNSHPLCIQAILKRILADNKNMAKLDMALQESDGDSTNSEKVLLLLKELILAGKSAKKPSAESHARPLNRQFLGLMRDMIYNDNQEEAQSRMKCIQCATVSSHTRVIQCMHLVCEECFVSLKEEISGTDLKIVCPSCPDGPVDVEKFDMNTSILSLRLEFLGTKVSGKGKKGNSKGKKLSSSSKNFFMQLMDQDDDDDLSDASIDWVAAVGGTMPSSKVLHTRDIIRKWLEEAPDTKIVIFTQFRAMATIFSQMCLKEEWAYTMLTGDLDFRNRQQSINDFQTKPEVRIIIASLKAGGIGLDLTSGNKCILVEPWWNDAIQQQAFCRLFRIGQTRDVEIVKLYTIDTIDNYMLELQECKLKNIEGAIGDATLPLSAVQTELMNYFGEVETTEGGGFIIHPGN